MDSVHIRLAVAEDAPAIARFVHAETMETEDIDVPMDKLSKGVDAVFENPNYGFYVVAEVGGEVAACLLVNPLWSHLRNGKFWWIQGVYVQPQHRKKGVYRRMYEFLNEKAVEAKDVCGFRLCVEKENEPATACYLKLGMTELPYVMYRALVPARPAA